jgi:putative SOS response-associated peptidase YedK
VCGRFVGFAPLEAIRDRFGVSRARTDALQPSYNVAPTQQVAVVFQEGPERVLGLMRWGLVPFWAKDPSIGSRMINARCETAAEKPSFRSAFRKRRCVIVNDGFFEWKGPRGRKRPFYFIPSGTKGPFGFAGLWERWRSRGNEDPEELLTCTILTTEASPSVSEIHSRMPAVLQPEAVDAWLDPEQSEPGVLNQILTRGHYRDFDVRPVSPDVNSPTHNGPNLIDPS